ncbi:MAG: DNA-directed RNA polymerase subunit L [Candidatus Hodarchaeales archaeon]
MQTKILRREESILEFEIAGEDHTFLNILRESLKDQEGVLFAAYRIPHPLLENPIFYLRTSNIDPIEALEKAADDIIDKCDALKEIIQEKLSDI